MTPRRRTLLTFGVSLVSLLGLGASLVAVPLIDDAAYGPKVTAVAPDEPARIGDWTFTLVKSGAFPGEGLNENSIPVGNALVAVMFRIEPGPGVGADDVASCDLELVQPSTGRSWEQAPDEEEFGYGLDPDSDTLCLMNDEPLQLEAVFLTVDGVADDVEVRLTSTALGFSDEFRFPLP